MSGSKEPISGWAKKLTSVASVPLFDAAPPTVFIPISVDRYLHVDGSYDPFL